MKLSVEKYVKEIIGLEMENVSMGGGPFPFDTIECWLGYRVVTRDILHRIYVYAAKPKPAKIALGPCCNTSCCCFV